MERPLTLKPLSIQDENSLVHHRKKVTVDGKSKTSRPLAKKGGVALESRKALNDITNKSSIHPEANSQCKRTEKKQSSVVENGFLQQHVFESKKKISVLSEKLNIVEEGFLHDHNKCIDAQNEAAAPSELNFWDAVLPGHDSTDLIMEQTKGDADNCYPKQLEELSMSEFSDRFECCWKSPPPSPVYRDCHLQSLSALEFDLVLKGDE